MFLFTEKNINYIFYIIERYIYKIKIRKKDNNDKMITIIIFIRLISFIKIFKMNNLNFNLINFFYYNFIF